MANLNTDSQIRYLIQWFNEWSDLQKSDFLPILVERYSKKAYVNGIVNNISALNCQDKPMSLFQCRMKLFKEWFEQWNSEQKDEFLKKISGMDAAFAEKLNADLQNGEANSENHENHENHINGEEILED